MSDVCLLRRWRALRLHLLWLLWGLLCLLLRLTTLFLLLLLRQMMPDYASGRRAGHGMMPGYVPRNGADGRTLQATFGLRRLGPDQQQDGRDMHGHPLRDPFLPHESTASTFVVAFIYTLRPAGRQRNRSELR